MRNKLLRLKRLRGAGALVVGTIILSSTVCAAAPTAVVSSQEAVSTVFNVVTRVDKGFSVANARHTANFTPAGLCFTPAKSQLDWRWQLKSATIGGNQINLGSATCLPTNAALDRIEYVRGSLTELYKLAPSGIEQLFVLSNAAASANGDLQIVGAVSSRGTLSETPDGWVWSVNQGAVRLGRVRVYDAEGKEILASMSVTSTETRIQIAQNELAGATYPITIDPEIMAADVRLSDMGPDGDHDFDAQEAAVAYNSVANEYLVVWAGDDTLGTVEGEFEIFGQRINAATGLEVGVNDFRISDMGPALDPAYDASHPSVAFNAAANEYLVVWAGDDNAVGTVDNENEIFGQRLSGATATEVGANDFRISDMGIDGNASFDADSPAITLNTTNNEYFVVWLGEDGVLPSEYEIYGQRLTLAGAQVGSNDFVISDMGPAADSNWSAVSPAVAYNNTNNEYLVVWQGEDNRGLLVEGEYELYGQRLAGATGAAVGTDDFRISDMGPDGNPTYDAARPAVAYSPTSNRYLVVWQGDDDIATVAGETEIFGQFIDGATGNEILGNDLQFSRMGPDLDPLYDAGRGAVSFDPTVNEFLVVWDGDNDGSGLVNGENEVYGQRVNAATGAEVGSNDFRLSDAGPDGFDTFDATLPALAYGPSTFLVVWEADDDTLAVVDNELEIYGQLVQAGTGAEIGANDFRISDMGPDGDVTFDARVPDVAYNSVNNEYLVVWEGDDSSAFLAEGETEIFGQRVDATTGLEVGANDFRISDMGPNGDPLFDAVSPSVAYNPAANQYLVVWSGEENTAPLINGEFEIFGQRLDAATGAEVGANDFRISDMGPDGSDIYDAETPDIAYNSAAGNYLVVWSGDDNTLPLVDGESEAFGQLLDGVTGAQSGTNDFRISDMGPDGDNLFDALTPAVAANPAASEYLVVWSGEENVLPLVNGEFEIFGQRIGASTGAAVGSNDFRISDMGIDGDALRDAVSPDIAYSPVSSQYLVVWAGDDAIDGETEIYGQRLSAVGAKVGANDQRLTDVGPDADPLWDAGEPAVASDSASGTFVVSFEAEDNIGILVDGETEIFVQSVSASTGLETGPNDLRISSMGLDGDPLFDATAPAVASAKPNGGFLIVWSGDDGSGLMVNDELEIFGNLTPGSGGPCCIGPTGNVDCDPANGTDISDLSRLIDFLYISFMPLCCPAEANVDGDVAGGLDISDLSALIDYLYINFTPPAACQ